ncbi:MAG: CYTH domain-containing protein [Planctomycetota bacterium]|jgi:predicted adenylyl cyclase CyaB
MRKNVELKAYCPDRHKALEAAKTSGGRCLRTHEEIDTYFRTPRGRLKLRTSDALGDCLIYYERPNTPQFKQSSFQIVPIGQSTSLGQLLKRALGVRAVVSKQRTTYEIGPALVNIDEVEQLGSFIEFEVDVAQAGSEQEASTLASHLQADFGVGVAETVAWSYADLAIMHKKAASWRGKLKEAAKAGTLFLFDGPSCSGKTTLVARLAGEKSFDITYVPRYCTRSRRKTEKRTAEYRFVSRQKFEDLAAGGAFIEYRDFEFGMSYGLPWKESMVALLDGRNAAGIINLGNIGHIKRVFPEAVTVLIDSPVEDIEKRLRSRGSHSEPQIEERLTNARNVQTYKSLYDHVVSNPDGKLEEAYQAVTTIVRSAACRAASA